MTSFEMLSLNTVVQADRTVVSVRGEVDAYSAPQLRTHLLSVLRADPPRHLIVDLGEVEFMDSTGLGVLVGAHRRLGEKGTMHVVCAREPIRKIFRITALDRLLPLYDSITDVSYSN